MSRTIEFCMEEGGGGFVIPHFYLIPPPGCVSVNLQYRGHLWDSKKWPLFKSDRYSGGCSFNSTITIETTRHQAGQCRQVAVVQR
jgi:hypothetical protein